jgi:NhaP-type Na+/H+ or K+/H+ antiporter
VIAALAFVLVTLGWVMASGRLRAHSVTGPIVLTAIGLLLAKGPTHVAVDLDSESVRLLIELTLALVLFNDASSVAVRWFLTEWHYPARLLGIGLPLTILLGAAAARLLFPDADIWVLWVVAAALAPTDAALGTSIIEDERIPVNFRQVINVESGLNDGLATPVVTFFIAMAAASVEGSAHPLGAAVKELVLAVAIGAVIGTLTGRLVVAAGSRGWALHRLLPIVPVLVALGTYLLAVEVGGNGFVAAFVVGVAFGATTASTPRAEEFLFTEQVSLLLGAGVWFVFGLAVLAPALSYATWPMVFYAVLSLTVVRMLPVAVAALGSRQSWDTVALAGWLGPRGLASIVFGILAFDAIGGPQSHLVLAAVAVTVAMSVLAHGLSAGPLATWYSARHPADESPAVLSPPTA